MRAAYLSAALTVAGFVTLIVFYAVGQPFGALNDASSVALAICLLPVAAALHYLQAPSAPSLSRLALAVGWLGMLTLAVLQGFVGGNGINYAVMDAVAAANELTGPLKAGHITGSDLARVQRQREWPTRIIQALVNAIQENLIASALDPNRPPFQAPGFLRWPILRDFVPHLFGFGLGRGHVKQ